MMGIKITVFIPKSNLMSVFPNTLAKDTRLERSPELDCVAGRKQFG